MTLSLCQQYFSDSAPCFNIIMIILCVMYMYGQGWVTAGHRTRTSRTIFGHNKHSTTISCLCKYIDNEKTLVVHNERWKENTIETPQFKCPIGCFSVQQINREYNSVNALLNAADESRQSQHTMEKYIYVYIYVQTHMKKPKKHTIVHQSFSCQKSNQQNKILQH